MTQLKREPGSKIGGVMVAQSERGNVTCQRMRNLLSFLFFSSSRKDMVTITVRSMFFSETPGAERREHLASFKSHL